MKTLWISIEAAIAAIGGVVGWYLGGLDGFLYALIVLWSLTTSRASCVP